MCKILNNLESVLFAEGVLTLKKCTKCKTEKRILEFNKHKGRPDGLSMWCKTCSAERPKEKTRVPDFLVGDILSRRCRSCKEIRPLDEFVTNNKCLNGRERQCWKCNYKHNKENGNLAPRTDESRAYERNRRKKHGKIYREKENAWAREYKKKNPSFKLAGTLRSRVKGALKKIGGRKNLKTIQLLGASIEEARKYIESLWLPGMSWDNHGFCDSCWHIDHIIPCCKFNLLDEEEQRKCFNYKNLQPLWQKENLSKNGRILTNETQV